MFTYTFEYTQPMSRTGGGQVIYERKPGEIEAGSNLDFLKLLEAFLSEGSVTAGGTRHERSFVPGSAVKHTPDVKLIVIVGRNSGSPGPEKPVLRLVE